MQSAEPPAAPSSKAAAILAKYSVRAKASSNNHEARVNTNKIVLPARHFSRGVHCTKFPPNTEGEAALQQLLRASLSAHGEVTDIDIVIPAPNGSKTKGLAPAPRKNSAFAFVFFANPSTARDVIAMHRDGEETLRQFKISEMRDPNAAATRRLRNNVNVKATNTSKSSKTSLSEGMTEITIDDNGKIFGRLPGGRSVELGPVDSTTTDCEKSVTNSLPQITCPKVRVILARTVADATKGVELLRRDLAADGCGCGVDTTGEVIHCLGFDTETKPKFSKGGPDNKVALIQLATSRTAILFQVGPPGFQLSACHALLALLSEPGILKVGVGVKADIISIRTQIPTFRCW